MTLLRIFPNYISTCGRSLDWQVWHKFKSITVKQNPANSDRLTTSSPRVTRRVTSTTMNCLCSRSNGRVFKKQSRNPDRDLQSDWILIFQPKIYLSILFIDCLRPWGFQWGKLHFSYCSWRVVVDRNDPSDRGAEGSIKTTKHETVDHSLSREQL